MGEISNMDDVIDLRDVIAAVEELGGCRLCGSSEGTHCEEYHDECPACQDGEAHPHEFDLTEEERAEIDSLRALLEECKGNGGDEQWRGDWYPVTLIRDSYFREYAQELADELGLVPEDYSWPTSCIDWDQAARELRMDYTSVDFDGVTYWVR